MVPLIPPTTKIARFGGCAPYGYASSGCLTNRGCTGRLPRSNAGNLERHRWTGCSIIWGISRVPGTARLPIQSEGIHKINRIAQTYVYKLMSAAQPRGIFADKASGVGYFCPTHRKLKLADFTLVGRHRPLRSWNGARSLHFDNAPPGLRCRPGPNWS